MQGEAWELARRAAESAGVEVRPLLELEETDLITEVMVETWGEHQLVPRELIHALQDSGNVPYGAFRSGGMLGYVLGFLGVDEEGIHMHSHMLAVRPGERSGGIGYALKLAQRAAALDLGARIVRWTFDPALRGNANFNFCKLGTIADRFERNFYGEMTDLLNRGERSDRMVIRWELLRAPGRRSPPPGEVRPMLRRAGPEDAPTPERAAGAGPLTEGSTAVAIPRDYSGLRERDQGLAREWRDALAEAFEACFAAGMIAAAFEPDDCEYRFTAPSAIADGPVE